MRGTLVKFGVVGIFLFSCSLFAQETKPANPEKPAETKPATPLDNTAFVVALAAKSAKMSAAVHIARATKDGDPTALLFHRIEDPDGNAIEAWLVSQKVKEAGAPQGRRLVNIMVYLNVNVKDSNGKDLEKPEVSERAARVVSVQVEDI